MTSTVVTAGAPLPELAHLAVVPDQPESGSLDSPVRGIIFGVDLRGCATLRRARSALKAGVNDAIAVARQHRDALHVIIVYSTAGARPLPRLQTAADALALHAHTALEWDARYVGVCVLDATACDDAPALRDRIIERVTGRVGGSPAVALTWDEIRDRSIVRATMEEYC